MDLYNDNYPNEAQINEKTFFKKIFKQNSRLMALYMKYFVFRFYSRII